MNAVESIRCSMGMAHGFSEALVKDMADAPLVRATPKSGHHTYWLLGHLVVSEAAVLDLYLLGRGNRHESWVTMFGPGTSPTDRAYDGCAFDELFEALSLVRSELFSFIDTLSDSDLDKPCHENDWPGPSFGSVGECLNALSLHMLFHAGQVACARRAAGRSPLSY